MTHNLNNEARDRLMNQTTEKINDLTVCCRDDIKSAIDFLLEAQSSSLTEPADTLGAYYKLANNKLYLGIKELERLSDGIQGLINCAGKIHSGEMNNGENK